jgi:hypothetical protein
MTAPLSSPSTNPRVPKRASSVLMMSLKGRSVSERKAKEETHFVKVVEFFWGNGAVHQGASLEVFSGAEPHGNHVHLAVRPMRWRNYLAKRTCAYAILSTTSCGIRFPFSSHCRAAGWTTSMKNVLQT